jgi:hypothetical protein
MNEFEAEKRRRRLQAHKKNMEKKKRPSIPIKRLMLPTKKPIFT